MEILIGTIIGFIILCFVAPFLNFLGGWISGWLIKITIGNMIVSGLSLIGIHIPIESFPLFFGTLNVIAGFFHATTINNKGN